MNQYAIVKDNKVMSVTGSLPRVFDNVSGFDKLPLGQLKKYGYMPLEKDDTVTPEGKKQDKSEYQIKGNKVIETKKFIDIPPEEIAEQEAKRKQEIKDIAADVLKATEFVMLEDAPFNQSEINNYKDMRKKLYDFIQDKVDSVDADKLKQFRRDIRDKPFSTNAVTV